MKLSIAICVHNEGDYIKELLKMLSPIMKFVEVVVVDDYSTDELTRTTLDQYVRSGSIRVVSHALNNDFAAHKNFMTDNCTGDWILNLDADEQMHPDLITQIPLIIEANPQLDAYWIPRVNTVDGLTLAHVQKWGWVLTKLDGFIRIKYIESSSDEYKLLDKFGFILDVTDGYVRYNQPIICWPDVQMRLYRRSPSIRWSGKVHERLMGYSQFSTFPIDVDYAIMHFKDIERQEKQNSYYEKLARP